MHLPGMTEKRGIANIFLSFKHRIMNMKILTCSLLNFVEAQIHISFELYYQKMVANID